jgi:hypothetical protein
MQCIQLLFTAFVLGKANKHSLEKSLGEHQILSG